MNAQPECYLLAIGPLSEALAQALAERLSDIADVASGTDGMALSVFESENGHWTVETISLAPPDLGAVQAAMAELGAAGPGFGGLSFCAMAHEDWVQRSYRGLPPVAAGRFVIHGSHDRERVPASRYAIQIDAGQAFGTAHHGTTRGCLIALDQIVRLGGVRNILDVGTGTGVLAIAAARAGTARILASDIDNVSVGVARENARINSALTRIRIISADGLRASPIVERSPYDLILANILPQPLKAMADDIFKALAPWGAAVISGLLSHQADGMQAFFCSRGFCRWRRIDLDGWTTLILRRRQLRPTGIHSGRTL